MAWFLSLVVLLVVLRRGEYRRQRPGIHWQSWVSDQVWEHFKGLSGCQVTLIVTGGRGKPPEDFAELADALQKDFDLWWQQAGGAWYGVGRGGAGRARGDEAEELHLGWPLG